MGIFENLADKFLNRGNDSMKPIQDPFEQDPEDKKLVDYVKGKIDQVRQSNSRITQEGLAFTNIAYLLGYDGVYYDTTFRQFRNVDPKRKLSRSRYRINKILPTVQNRLARLTQNAPKYDVKPNSDSSEDKDCARLGLEVLSDIFEKQNFTEKRQEISMNAMQAGISYLQVSWDPMLGEPMIDPETEEMSGFAGDVRLEPLNMFEVFADPLAKNIDDSQWLIKAKVRKLDYFKERYPDRGAAVKEEGVWLASSLYDMKANALTSVGIAGASTTEQQTNSAIEIVYYEKRSKDYPRGRMIVVASGILLEDKEMPVGEYDIVKFDDVLIGGRYNAEAIITHLRPVQDQYNILRTRMAGWIRMNLAGKYLVAKGANLSQEAMNNSDSEVVEYNPVPNAGPPQAMSIPTIPQYAYEEINSLNSEFDFISGMSEPTRGETPSSSMPAKGLEFLVEQNQTRISVQTSRNEVAFARIGRLILKYVCKYYELPRMLKTAGDGLGYAVKEFKGQDLGDNYDCTVVPGSTIPDSKVLKRQDIVNLMNIGLLGNVMDPKVRQQILKEMEFGNLNDIWKSQALDEQQIKKTLTAIQDGQMPELHEWDNHVMFVQEMNDFRKSDKFADMSEHQKEIFNYVCEWHVQAEIQLRNPQIPQQQMMAQQMVDTMHEQQATGQTPPPDPSQQMPPQQQPQPGPGMAPPMGA